MASLSFRKRLFAWLLYKGEKFNFKLYDPYKRDLFRHINGRVVEIGPGTGVNFNYLPDSIDWIGVEPNTAFHKMLESRCKEKGIKMQLTEGNAEHTSLPDSYADTVLFTLVLCSVDNPAGAVEEMKRILKPGGKIVFIEHVAAKRKSTIRFFQDLSNPVNRFMADGCNCNRETWKEIEKAGFSSVQLTHRRLNGTMILHCPHIMGYAVK
jgi:ubiquinone/menaquinone biosynthesis C-methylase UbiE